MKLKSYYLIIGVIILVVFISARQINNTSFSSIKNLLAGVFFVDSITEEELRSDYSLAKNKNGKIKILIVPGHDDGIGGTEFRGIRESELNIEMAEAFTRLLRKKMNFPLH